MSERSPVEGEPSPLPFPSIPAPGLKVPGYDPGGRATASWVRIPPRPLPLRAVLTAGRDRAPHHQGAQAPIQRLRRALPSHPTGRALPRHGAQKVLRKHRVHAKGPRRPPRSLQYRAAPPGPRHEGQDTSRCLRPMPAQAQDTKGGQNEESRLTPIPCREAATVRRLPYLYNFRHRTTTRSGETSTR